MIFVGIGAFAILLAVIAVFAFPALSPIPYFPSNKKDTDLILKALNLKNGEILIDLGAGDGWVVFEAARRTFNKKMNTTFVADEINPILYLVMQARRFFHPNKKNIRVVLKDMFKMHDSPLPPGKPVFYLYVSPWFLDRIYFYIKKNFPGYRIVTYFYKIPSLKPKKTVLGEHKIFIY